MKKMIKMSIIPLMMGATSLYATNGTNLMGFNAVNQGMGGTGIAYAAGAPSALVNPALIKGNEVSFGVTYFQPSVSVNEHTMMGDAYVDSASDKSVIPDLTFSFDISDKLTFGVGMYGSAGVGVDYRDSQAPMSAQMLTNLQIMKFALPIAYQATENLRLGFAPVAQYGSLSLAYNNGASFATPQGNVGVMTGSGISQDFGFGYELGAVYDVPKTPLSLGVVYKSAVEMEYKDKIGMASSHFNLNGGAGFGDILEQPSEFGVGVTYKGKDRRGAQHVVNLDYKRIAWGAAQGYSDFKWEDQNVFAVGYEYSKDRYALRAGYNYAASPISEQPGSNMMTEYEGAAINYFNLTGFPATVETHYTAGASYQISKRFSVDVSYIYTPEVENTYDISAMTQAMAQNPNIVDGVSSKHSQQAIAFGFSVKF